MAEPKLTHNYIPSRRRITGTITFLAFTLEFLHFVMIKRIIIKLM